MSPFHEIVIDNIKPNETFEYSMVLIKGHITNKKPSSCQQNDFLFAKTTSNDSRIRLLENKFKILVGLENGKNTISLAHCCCSINFQMIYKKRSTDFCVVPLYIICDGHDGKFQAPETERNDLESALARITTCTKLLQCIVGEKFYQQRLDRKSFQLKSDCQIYRSKLNYLEARRLTQEELWTALGTEILCSEIADCERTKFFGFLSCTRYYGDGHNDGACHEDILRMTQGYVALGRGGFALLGTACLFTWPENVSQVMQRFQDSSAVDKRKFMDDSCYRGTLGMCFSTTLGSALHELCHTFDLGHTKDGIMGRGFDNTYTFFTCDDEIFWTHSCLLLLYFHRWFNRCDSSKNIVPKYEPTAKFVSATHGIRVIEIRNETDEMVIKDWTFTGRIAKHFYQLPEGIFEKHHKLILFVEDNNGNMLRESLFNEK